MSTMNAADLARRVLALCELLQDEDVSTFKVKARPCHKDPNLVWIDFGDREPEKSYAVSPAGRVLQHTCEYSGHNGDSYGDAYVFLDEEKALRALESLNSRLERRALDAEERRLEQARLQRQKADALKNLNARLKNKGFKVSSS